MYSDSISNDPVLEKIIDEIADEAGTYEAHNTVLISAAQIIRKEREKRCLHRQISILVQDDDGHWYIIPTDKKEEWNHWFYSDDYDDGVCPEWAKQIDGPHRIEILEYKIVS